MWKSKLSKWCLHFGEFQLLFQPLFLFLQLCDVTGLCRSLFFRLRVGKVLAEVKMVQAMMSVLTTTTIIDIIIIIVIIIIIMMMLEFTCVSFVSSIS